MNRYMLWVEANHPVTDVEVEQVRAWADRLEPLAPYVQFVVATSVQGVAEGVYERVLPGERRKLKIIPGVKTYDEIGISGFDWVPGWIDIAAAASTAAKQCQSGWCLLDHESTIDHADAPPMLYAMKTPMGLLNAVGVKWLWYPFNTGKRFWFAQSCLPWLSRVSTVGTEWIGRQGYSDALTLVKPRRVIPLHWTNTQPKRDDLGNHIARMHASGARILMDQPGWDVPAKDGKPADPKTTLAIARLLELAPLPPVS